jgi:hypothetical protein
MYLTDITCNPIKGEVNVDSRYTYHHHARNDKSIGSTRVHQEKEKVHEGAKEVNWKCLQENKKGQQQVQGLV